MKTNIWLTSISINITNDYSAELRNNDSFEDYTDSYYFRNVIKDIKRNIPTKETIINDIILATIDSTSVDEIMKTLKQKYK